MITIASAYSPKVATPSRPYLMQLCRDAVPTLPTTAAGTRSRLPKAERLKPEGLMPRWPAPVTFKKIPEANFPVSGLPLSESHPDTCHPKRFSRYSYVVTRSRPYPWHLGQHAVLPHPQGKHSPDTRYSMLYTLSLRLANWPSGQLIN